MRADQSGCVAAECHTRLVSCARSLFMKASNKAWGHARAASVLLDEFIDLI